MTLGACRVRIHPDPGVPVEQPDPIGRHAQRHQCTDHNLLQLTNVLWSVMGASPHGADRVADQLTGTVECDVAPTIDSHQIGTDLGWVDEHMCRVCVRPEGVHRTVFEKQQVVIVGPGC